MRAPESENTVKVSGEEKRSTYQYNVVFILITFLDLIGLHTAYIWMLSWNRIVEESWMGKNVSQQFYHVPKGRIALDGKCPFLE